MPNVTSAPRVEPLSPTRHGSIEHLLRRQRALGWSLSLLMLVMTTGFFGLMSLDAPILSRVAFGRAVTLANVAAIGIILMSLLSIAIFGLQARQIDARLALRRKA
jgi:uncharacterized membrane protein (DUF485 family)